VLALAGCAAESQLLDQAPDFTADRLREGGLAVLGVVQVDEVAQVRPALVDALERVLSAVRRDIPLVPATRARGALPDSVERIFLLGYQMHGEPDRVSLTRVAREARASARYGILARVESAPIRYGSRQVVSGMPGDERRDVQVRVTGRDAHISVRIYDLSTLAAVFNAKYIGSSDVAPMIRPPSEDSLKAVTREATAHVNPGVRTAGIGGPEDGFPDAPPVARAAEASFLLMARDLPGAPPSPPPATTPTKKK
jgi:hypothetical protein